MSAAIPTVYRNVRFRSRLEATWAAFFDQLGWPWKYEPIDLAGYIPDFILPTQDGGILVEVKPALTPYELANEEAIAKIEASGWTRDAVIVGTGLMREPGRRGLAPPILGWGTTYWDGWKTYQVEPDEEPPGPWDWYWRELVVCNRCEHPSAAFSSDEFCMWDCGGMWNENKWTHTLAAPMLDGPIDKAWATAQNATQWKPPPRRRKRG